MPPAAPPLRHHERLDDRGLAGVEEAGYEHGAQQAHRALTLRGQEHRRRRLRKEALHVGFVNGALVLCGGGELAHEPDHGRLVAACGATDDDLGHGAFLSVRRRTSAG
jgi:hypothetical protein